MFDAILRPVLIAALIALVAIMATSMLATTTTQVCVLFMALMIVTLPMIVDSTFERHSFIATSRGSDYLPAFEFIVRPAIMLLPVLGLAWAVRLGAASGIGIDEGQDGMVVGLGLAAIADSVRRRRYVPAW